MARPALALAAALAVAALAWPAPDDRPEVLVVGDRDQTVPDPGTTLVDIPAAFPVTNTGSETLWATGCESACGRGCCYTWGHAGPVELPPGRTVPVTVLVTPKAAGAFRADTHLFLTDRQRIRRIPVTVRGSAVDAPGGPVAFD